MTKNPPVELTVISASPVNQYNKQQLQAQTPKGLEFTLNLTDKSPKLPAGIINASHTFEIWEYAPPGKPAQWYGTLQEKPTSFPQLAPQLPTKAPQNTAGAAKTTPDDQSMRIVRSNALNAVLSATEIPSDMIEDYLLSGIRFILGGGWRLEPRTSHQEPEGEGIPWED